jgi:hypothetical protein
MAFYDTTWYCNFGNGTSTGYYAVPVRPQNTAVAAGVLCRQFTTPAVGSERVFVCIVAGTTANTTDATWVLTRGAKTTDGTVTWQECTGASAVNGDITNTPAALALRLQTPSIGVIIKNDVLTHLFICTTAGSCSTTVPTFNTTTGATTADSGAVWTCIGPVSNFTGGQAPFARLATVVSSTWLVTSTVFYTIYVGDNHAETQSTAMNISFTSTIAPLKILCHNHSGPYPPAAGDLMTGATLTTSGNTQITLQIGPFYIYGLTFIGSATGVSATNYLILKATNVSLGQLLYFDNCSFQIANNVGNASILIGDSTIQQPDWIVWNNCTVKFGAAQSLQLTNCRFHWKNTGQVLVSGSTVPGNLFTTPGTSGVIDAMLEALDLSQLSNSLWTSAGATAIGNLLIKDCKLHASATVTPPASPGMIVQLVRCDSGATAYKSTRYVNEGTETTETSITRVGGAVDPSSQAQSRKIVTGVNAHWLRPFRAEPYAIWNGVTGANVVVTVDGTINAGSVPNNDDIWIEVEYLGSSATPLGTTVTTTKSNVLAANAAVASDGSSWNGGGSGAGWSPFKLVATLSSPQPGMAGYIDVRVCAAKASTTFYLDPKIELS